MNHLSAAQEFRNQGQEQLGNLLLGEEGAKLGLLTAMVMGENILFVGPPGGGKTTLGNHAHRLIDGISSEHVAEIPPLSDLTPVQLVGGVAESTKEVTVDGETRKEITRVEIEPILKPTTKVIFSNEINRVNPYALNASLEAFESGVVTSTEGSVYLDELEYGLATMNPSEGLQATFPMSHAQASRFAIGAVLGLPADDVNTRESHIRRIASGWRPQPEKIDSVTDLSDLHTMREAVDHIAIPDDLMPVTINFIKATNELLAKDHNIEEADSRMAKQLSQTAKTLAMLAGQETVQPPQLKQAVGYVLAGRLGALTREGAQHVKAAYQYVMEQAK